MYSISNLIRSYQWSKHGLLRPYLMTKAKQLGNQKSNLFDANIQQKRTLIGLDPLVTYIAEAQKRNFVKTVLPKNIASTFRRESNEDQKKSFYLHHSGIDQLKQEMEKLMDSSTQIKGKDWVCYYGPSRCGVSIGVQQASLGLKGIAYISLRQQGTDEPFSLFIAKQLQSTEFTKFEKLEPGDLKVAFKQAINHLIEENITPILVIDDFELALDTVNDKYGIRKDVRAFMDQLVQLADSLVVYLITTDIRLTRALKMDSEIREHLKFRSWNYASYDEVIGFLKEVKANLTEEQMNEASITMMGHDGDFCDYTSGLLANLSHKQELDKIVNRGYLQLREVLVHPPNKYSDPKSRKNFRIITFSLFYAIYQNLRTSFNNSGPAITFPVNERVVISLTTILTQNIRKFDSKITVDEVLVAVEVMMSQTYGILQEVNLEEEDVYNEVAVGDVWLTWAATKYQYAMERLGRDRLVVEIMREAEIDIPSLLNTEKID